MHGPSRRFVFRALIAILLGNLRVLYSSRSLSFVNLLGPSQLFPTMYISRTQFYLVLQAIRYIVQSSTNECGIPQHGYICIMSNPLNSAVILGYDTQEMHCMQERDPNDKDEKILTLDPVSIGEHCANYFYEYGMDILRISPTKAEISKERAFEVYPSKINQMQWNLQITKLRWSTFRKKLEVDWNVLRGTEQMEFSSQDIFMAPSGWKIHQEEAPYAVLSIHVKSSENVVFKVKLSEITHYSEDNKWKLGYKQLQRHKVQFIKSGQEFWIVVREDMASEEPSTSTAFK